MRRNLTRLADTSFDLLVIGGGIHGVCAAWDAASRGLSTALLERDDFGSATSANSMKILHGGLRYLQQADFRRMRRSIRERAILLGLAPHLTRPLPVAVPTYRGLRESRAALWAALRISEVVGAGASRTCRGGRWPAGRILDRGESLRAFPWIEPKGLTGAALWYDGQAVNSERLTLSFLLSAAQAGAEAANYLEAARLLKEGSRIVGVRALDRLGGEEVEIRARMVLNAAGPWSGSIMALSRGPGAASPALLPQALAINLISRRLAGDTAVGVRSLRGAEEDPVGGGYRYLFFVPWRDRTLIGTSYRAFTGEPRSGAVTEEDLRSLMADWNQACPGLALSWDDLTFYHGGFLPLRGAGGRGGGMPLASESRILDHGRLEGMEGLVSIQGLKYTTARLVAEQALDLVFRKLGRTPPPCRTARVPLWGGEAAGGEKIVAGVTAGAARRLQEVYGSRWGDVARLHRNEAGWAEPVAAGCPVLRCEVLHAVREEMAVHLSDVVLRRTDLGTAGCPPRPHLAAVAGIMGEELGWTEERRSREVEDLRKAYRPLPVGPEER